MLICDKTKTQNVTKQTQSCQIQLTMVDSQTRREGGNEGGRAGECGGGGGGGRNWGRKADGEAGSCEGGEDPDAGVRPSTSNLQFEANAFYGEFA